MTPELYKLLGKEKYDNAYEDLFQDDISEYPTLVAMEKVLLERYKQIGYAGEEPEGDNYLLEMDWFPAMSAEDMDEFGKVIKSIAEREQGRR